MVGFEDMPEEDYEDGRGVSDSLRANTMGSVP